MRKNREFWVFTHGGINPHYELSRTEPGFGPLHIAEKFKVIEYSALLASEARCESLLKENEKYIAEMKKINNGIPSEWAYSILQKRFDAAQFEAEKMANEANLWKERCEKLVEALRFYADADNLCYEEKIQGKNILLSYEGSDGIASVAVAEYETHKREVSASSSSEEK